MNYFDVFNEYDKDIKEIDLVYDFISYALDKLEINNVMFNIIIIDDKKIHEINKKYRDVDRPTDVISFALEDGKKIEIPNIRILGDIYISYDKVIKQAKVYNHSTKREICFLAIHGLLHLLGYDHMNVEEEKVMFGIQKEMLNSYGLKKES